MKRKFMFIAILFLALVTLGCASAADEIQAEDIGAIDDVQSEDVYISEDSASEEILTDGNSGSGSLSDLKNDIENAGTTKYDLSRDYSYDEDVDEDYWMNTYYMDIDNFVLDGKGYTINGGNKTWIFNFEFGKNITLKNINFVNGLGVVNVNGRYPINIINCNFTECSQSAITDAGSSIIESCNFIGNTADCGGAIYSTSNTTIYDCFFRDNLAIKSGENAYGGAIYLDGPSPLVITCEFYENRVERWTSGKAGGGAIYVSKIANNATIFNCLFYANKGYEGGAINAYNSTMINYCLFEANKADCGGAVYTGWTVSIHNSTFIDNVAEYKGGAIYANELNLTNSDFKYNNATESGGAINTYSHTTIINSNFTENSDNSGISNICANEDEVTISNVDTGNQIIASDASYSINSGGKYSVTVKGTDGNALVGENVTFSVGNKVIGSGLSDANGLVSIDLSANILKGLKAGTHNLQIILVNLYQDKNVKLTINKVPAVITAKAASFVINYAGRYSVTIRNTAGNLLSGQKVTFTLNGKSIGSATTNAKGVATISLSAKVLKAAKYGTKNLVIKLDSPLYTSASKTVKVTIKKEKTSIVATKKSFKKSLKVKKYTITLKNSKGKIIKNAKLTLKVKGKTFKATTNSKGKATFKITNLKKKGKFTASINFKTTPFYLKASKSVQLTIK